MSYSCSWPGIRQDVAVIDYSHASKLVERSQQFGIKSWRHQSSILEKFYVTKISKGTNLVSGEHHEGESESHHPE